MARFERGSAATGESQRRNSLAPPPEQRTPVKRKKRIICQFAYNNHNQQVFCIVKEICFVFCYIIWLLCGTKIYKKVLQLVWTCFY